MATLGRLALLGAVVFWWGGVIVPGLISLAFPGWLVVHSQMHPQDEGTAANAVSASALLAAAFLALAAAVLSRRREGGWCAAAGWAVIAAASAYLAVDELADLHLASMASVGTSMFDGQLFVLFDAYGWVVLWSPLLVGFVLVTGVFMRTGLRGWEVRIPLGFGLAAWVLAVIHEVSYPPVFAGRAGALATLTEESLEFGGTLLIGLSAAIALRGAAWNGRLAGRRVLGLLAGAAVITLTLGSLSAAFLFRAPLIDARPQTSASTFLVALQDEMSTVQELRASGAPLGEISLRLTHRDPEGRAGIVAWRVREGDAAGRILREGRLEIPTTGRLDWRSLDLMNPFALPEGRRLVLQLTAETAQGAYLGVGATKTDMYPDGRLWVNGELTWPDQDLAFAVYGAPELTRSKLGAVWHLVTSDWRWPVLLAELAVGLTLLTLTPGLLAVSALRPGFWGWR